MTEQDKMKYGYYRDLKEMNINTLKLLARNADISGWQKMKKSDLQKTLWENYTNTLK